MKFDENPFRVLNVSIYDTKATISEQADDLSFADPDSEKIFEAAKNILLNPRKRISAEVHWFVDEKINVEDIFKDILRVDESFSELKAENLRRQINSARAKSGFPAVQDTKSINDELKNLRDEIREKIQSRFKILSHNERTKFADDVANFFDYGGSYPGVIVDDFFDSYQLEIAAFLDKKTKEITALLFKIKINPDENFLTELATKVWEFVHARKPLDNFSELLGRNSFDESEKIFYEVRDVAITLHNDKKLIDEPLIIIGLLARNFSYLPKLADLIRKDVKFLEDAKARRPTQIFVDAKAKLDAIRASLNANLYFDESRGGRNAMFYFNVFKPINESTLLEVMSRQGYKPSEWKILNAMTASIYIQVGTAMTWARRADLAFEMFQKALPYAETSETMKLISLARERIDEFRSIAQPSLSEQCKGLLKEILKGILSIPVIGPYLLVIAFFCALAKLLDFISWILSFFR